MKKIFTVTIETRATTAIDILAENEDEASEIADGSTMKELTEKYKFRLVNTYHGIEEITENYIV